MDLKKEISSEVQLELDLTEEGTAELTIAYGGKLGGAKLIAYVDLADLVDKITDLIPGEWDDMLIDNAVAKLLSKKSDAKV